MQARRLALARQDVVQRGVHRNSMRLNAPCICVHKESTHLGILMLYVHARAACAHAIRPIMSCLCFWIVLMFLEILSKVLIFSKVKGLIKM